MSMSGGFSIGLSMGFGFAGTVSRTPDIIIENKFVKSDSADIPFGFPVMLNDDNTFSFGGASLTAANFAGVSVAEVKQQTIYGTSQEGSGLYLPDQPMDVLQRGIITVQVREGTPVAGGPVYVRKSTSSAFPDAVIGGFEAEADGIHTVQLTNCSWNTGLVDANGMAELKIKSINN